LVLVGFVDVVVDVVSGGEQGLLMGGTSFVKAGAGLVALAARFGEGRVGRGAPVSLDSLFSVLRVEPVCAALQALYFSFEPRAL
jgi:hypothetical protein